MAASKQNYRISLTRKQQEISGKTDYSIESNADVLEVLRRFKRQYPEDERWRLFVDGNNYAQLADAADSIVFETNPDKDGWKEFEEREPGCITAFFIAWNDCLDEI